MDGPSNGLGDPDSDVDMTHSEISEVLVPSCALQASTLPLNNPPTQNTANPFPENPSILQKQRFDEQLAMGISVKTLKNETGCANSAEGKGTIATSKARNFTKQVDSNSSRVIFTPKRSPRLNPQAVSPASTTASVVTATLRRSPRFISEKSVDEGAHLDSMIQKNEFIAPTDVDLGKQDQAFQPPTKNSKSGKCSLEQDANAISETVVQNTAVTSEPLVAEAEKGGAMVTPCVAPPTGDQGDDFDTATQVSESLLTMSAQTRRSIKLRSSPEWLSKSTRHLGASGPIEGK